MRGYVISSSKIWERKSFAQKSRSTKEHPCLLDQDVDLDHPSRSKQIKNNQEHPLNVNNNDIEKALFRRDPHWLFKGQLNGGEEGKRTAMRPATLRRNFSATSLYQRNKSSSIMLERPSSSRSNIQGAMKRAFSMKLRRSSSASSQSEYCRIIHDQDQPFRVDDHDDIDNNHDREGDYYYNVDQQDDSDCPRKDSNGSMEKRYLSTKHKGSNSKSNVLRACRRLFSRKFA